MHALDRIAIVSDGVIEACERDRLELGEGGLISVPRDLTTVVLSVA